MNKINSKANRNNEITSIPLSAQIILRSSHLVLTEQEQTHNSSGRII